MKLSVIVPVYNEDPAFIDLLDRVDKVHVEKEILVVDDGSMDNPETFVRAAGIPNLRFFRHPVNRGKGAAIRTALAEASGDVVIIQDADFEYYPEDYVKLMQIYEEQGVKVVYGVRDLSERAPLMRWGNWFVTWVANLLYGSNLKDMETCYKMVDTSLLRSLDLQSNRFEIEAEISAKLLRAQVRIAQTPIQYSPRREGKKLSPTDGLPTVYWLMKCRFWRPPNSYRE